MTDLGDGQRRNHQTRPVASKELSAPNVVAVSLVEGCDERSRLAANAAAHGPDCAPPTSNAPSITPTWPAAATWPSTLPTGSSPAPSKPTGTPPCAHSTMRRKPATGPGASTPPGSPTPRKPASPSSSPTCPPSGTTRPPRSGNASASPGCCSPTSPSPGPATPSPRTSAWPAASTAPSPSRHPCPSGSAPDPRRGRHRHRRTARRPWEKQPDPGRPLTPGRVRRGFRNIRRGLGTPARVAKPSRPGPGRPKGSSKGPHPATRSPAKPPNHTKQIRRLTRQEG